MNRATRTTEILDAVVRLNIETGSAVSSGLVSRFLQSAFSPATVRVVMKELEEMGLLLQPHKSAGRLPTDEGYRAFVDRVVSAWPLHRQEPPALMQQQVDQELRHSAGTDSMVKVLATILSDITANISIILGPSWESLRVVRLDIYPQEQNRVLMVLILENGVVRTGRYLLDRHYSPAVLQEAGRILAERICGRSVASLHRGVLMTGDETKSEAGQCVSELAAQGMDLFADFQEGEIELEGVANVLSEPEFSEPEYLKALIHLLDSPVTIREALHRLSPRGEGEFSVWIGKENPIGELRSFSLLSTSFDWAGRRGILAVLGPRRMPYQRAFTGMEVLRRSLQGLS